MKISDDELLRDLPRLGVSGVARLYDMSERAVHYRRRALEVKLGEPIQVLDARFITPQDSKPRPKVRKLLDIVDGMAVISSDHHYWPNEVSTAHLALLDFLKTYQPQIVILNGDVLDGASISRHPPLGWDTEPDMEQEVETVGLRVDEIEKASPGAAHYWNYGNHCQRFDAYLARMAKQYRGVSGMTLAEHFPNWIFGMALHINEGPQVVVKHRFKGGMHARHNNALWGGSTMVTGHTHQQGVSTIADYQGVRWGVECGTMAEPMGPQFDYGEDNPKNHISGFAVLTWKDGVLLKPEVVWVPEVGVYEFRGERHQVAI